MHRLVARRRPYRARHHRGGHAAHGGRRDGPQDRLLSRSEGQQAQAEGVGQDVRISRRPHSNELTLHTPFVSHLRYAQRDGNLLPCIRASQIDLFNPLLGDLISLQPGPQASAQLLLLHGRVLGFCTLRGCRERHQRGHVRAGAGACASAHREQRCRI